jgi:hypothetical protein
MPSLVYITRINQLSEELAGHLRSAGLQVQSFAPGDITADECLLAITPEAIKAGLPSGNHLTPALSQRTDAKLQAGPPLDGMSPHPGSQEAIWKIFDEFTAPQSTIPRQPPSQVVPPIRARGMEFIPSGLGQRVFAASAPSPASSPQSQRNIVPSSEAAKSGVSLLRPSRKKFRIAGAQIPALWLAHAALLKGGLRRRGLLKPLAAAALLLLFAIALMTNRAASAAPAADPTAAFAPRVQRADSSFANSTRPAALPSLRVMEDPSDSTPSPSSINAPRASGRSHISDNDFIAEDFTNHYDLRLRPAATQQTPELQRDAQDNPRPKRIVMN